MKIRFLTGLLWCFAVILPAHAQNYKGGLTFYQHSLVQKGDSLHIDFEIVTKGLSMDADQHLTLTPVLKDGKREKRMPGVVLNGKNKQRLYRRMQVLDKKNKELQTLFAINAGKANSSRYPYKLTIRFEEWMKNASFCLEQVTCGCGNTQRETSVEMLSGGITLERRFVRYDVKPLANFITPPVEAVKQRQETGSAYLDFAVGKSNIQMDLGNNPAELAKINTIVNTIRNDENIKIDQMLISGYASPDGTYAGNKKLSESRAGALKNYLQNLYGFPAGTMKSEGLSEDWNGFESLLRESTLPYKEKALDIVRSADSYDLREKKLMQLQGGIPYREMKQDLFPKLRRVEYKFGYTVTPFSVEQGKKILKTRPALLSLNEMYLIANTYSKNSPEFKEVFEVAVRLYPESPVSNLNAAAAAIEAGDIQSAKRFLDKIKDREEAQNNLGVVYLLEANYEKAKECFQKAAAAGIPEATHNLRETKQKLKNLEEEANQS